MIAVVTDMAVAFVAVINALLVELGALVVPCDAFVEEPRGTMVEVPGVSIVAGTGDLAVLPDDHVLPLVVASIAGVGKCVSVAAPVSTEVVTVALVAAVTGRVVFVLVGVLVAASVVEPFVAGVAALSLVLASVSKPCVVESYGLVVTVSMEVVGLGTVPWYVDSPGGAMDVASGAELVADATKVVVAITWVVLDL